MKKFLIIAVLFCASVNTIANDTIAVDMAKIERIVADKTKNTKGKEVIKYYAIINGELVNTSKTVAEKYALCKRLGVKCALVVVRSRSSKRLILN